MDPLDEGVDVFGNRAYFILTFNLDAASQIAVATGEIGNRFAQGFQRGQRAVDGDIGEACHDQYGDKPLNERGGNHAAYRLVGDLFIHHHAVIPVGIGNGIKVVDLFLAADHQLVDHAVMGDLIDVGRSQFRCQSGSGFQAQGGIWVRDDGAIAVHQHGVGALGGDRQNVRNQ